ncbi:MAG: GDSL-type esterase/lipase family protein, partial [Solirubrobacteraceae bacterium]|nr:GDSL-type esterase/lipase family protein [Solirubrobacteraceae bacterium]
MGRGARCTLFLVLLASLATAGSARAALPTSVAALGDSYTVALFSGTPCAAAAVCPANSWATGGTPAVDSHALRLGRLGAPPAVHNFAVSGRKVADLNSGNNQAQRAINAGAQYVTIMLGLNDSCRESEAAMTTVAAFRAQFEAGLSKLVAGLPGARIFVTSIPDAERLRMILKDDANARSAWASQQVCSVVLDDPLSNAAAVVERRQRARQRVIDFNRQLEEVCAQYPTCRYDGGAVFGWAFEPADFVTRDYFHLSTQGQASLATVTWAATHDFGSPPPPPPSPPPEAGASYSERVMTHPSLQSYWRLGESSGTTARDLKGGRDGTYAG